jgi:predicted SPOUT superfamily RNA methylase MTH1
LVELIFGIIMIVGSNGVKIPINLDAIVKVESNGKAKAYNRYSQARGVFQITPIVLVEWNERHHELRFKHEDLFDQHTSHEVAKWYLSKRIPEMLEYYDKPVNLRNILICWNAGIRAVVLHNQLPQETTVFIERYEKEVANANKKVNGG